MLFLLRVARTTFFVKHLCPFTYYPGGKLNPPAASTSAAKAKHPCIYSKASTYRICWIPWQRPAHATLFADLINSALAPNGWQKS